MSLMIISILGFALVVAGICCGDEFLMVIGALIDFIVILLVMGVIKL